ncbi:hypothetical protein F2P79_013833 [Pimephales promelas]|nr:hypothetical protein F2P79_013833 [Pimephales promelas]
MLDVYLNAACLLKCSGFNARARKHSVTFRSARDHQMKTRKHQLTNCKKTSRAVDFAAFRNGFVSSKKSVSITTVLRREDLADGLLHPLSKKISTAMNSTSKQNLKHTVHYGSKFGGPWDLCF